MKFKEWMKIREATAQSGSPTVKPAKPLQPGEAAKKNKTQTTIKTTLARVVGKPTQVQVKELQNVAKKLAIDPNADDEAMKDIDSTIKKIQGE